MARWMYKKVLKITSSQGLFSLSDNPNPKDKSGNLNICHTGRSNCAFISFLTLKRLISFQNALMVSALCLIWQKSWHGTMPLSKQWLFSLDNLSLDHIMGTLRKRQTPVTDVRERKKAF